MADNTNGNGRSKSVSGDLNPNAYSNVMRRPSKNLPQPPVGPVMPDFDDLVRRRGSANNYLSAELDPAGAPVKRKTSVVKKLTGRVSRREAE